MRFAQAVSTAIDAEAAAGEVATSIREQIDGNVDLAVLHCTPHYRGHYAPMLERIRTVLSPTHVIGCTGEGLFGGGGEFDATPAVALLAASVPGATLEPFAIGKDDLSEDRASATLEASGIGGAAADRPALVLLAEPFSTPVDLLLDAVNAVCPGWPVVGGMASVMQEGANRLFLDDAVVRDGVVGLAIGGSLRVHTLVSQGCRPVGKPFVVTKADRNIVMTLGGKPAFECVQEVYANANPEEQELMSSGLLLGRVINEQQEAFERGDFLVRNVMGFDQQSGAVIAGDFFRAGQTIQFHVRDTATADEDLDALLASFAATGRTPLAGLCFSCNGRGRRMFDDADHETKRIHDALGAIPIVGHFAAGEFGTLGGQAFIHGHTLSLGLFYTE